MILFALLIGSVYGYVSVKGQFCMNSGFSNVIRQKDTTKLKSFAIAILLQMMVLPLLFTILYSYEPTKNMIVAIGLPPLFIIGSAVGGFLFGIFMYYTAGCGAGIFYKIGEKNSGAIIAAIGFTLGIYLTEKGLLKIIRELSQDSMVVQQQPIWKENTGMLIAVFVSLITGFLLFLVLKRKDKQPNGAVWGWKKTGLVVGSIGIIGWIFALLAESSYGMAIIPGVLDAVALNYSWGLLFVFGIVLGAFYSTRKDQSKRFLIPKKEIIFKRFFGGIGLGASGSIAAGCTVGHGLTFAPLLGIGSIIVTFFIFLGSGLVGYLTKK